jgi:hypothetical protein
VGTAPAVGRAVIPNNGALAGYNSGESGFLQGGVGRLYITGDLANAKVAYCPGMPPGKFQAAYVPNDVQWETVAHYVNYEWNPHWAYANASESTANISAGFNAASQPLVPAYMTLASLPQTKCLALDMFYDFPEMAHTDGATTATVNVLYGDAHVVSVILPSQLMLGTVNGVAGAHNYLGIVLSPVGFTWPSATGQVTPTGANSQINLPGYPYNWTAPAGGWQSGISTYIDVAETLGNQGDATSGPLGAAGFGKYPATDPYGMTYQRFPLYYPQ